MSKTILEADQQNEEGEAVAPSQKDETENETLDLLVTSILEFQKSERWKRYDLENYHRAPERFLTAVVDAFQVDRLSNLQKTRLSPLTYGKVLSACDKILGMDQQLCVYAKRLGLSREIESILSSRGCKARACNEAIESKCWALQRKLLMD